MKRSDKIPQRLYECDECHERHFFHPTHFDRRTRPRCPGCGCTRLELVSEEAKADAARKQALRVQSEKPIQALPAGRPKVT